MGSENELQGDAMQHEMPTCRPNRPSPTRTVTFSPAPDMTSGSETATVDTEEPLGQHLEQESCGQQYPGLAVLNLVRNQTYTHSPGTAVPGKTELRDTSTVHSPLPEKKEYSRSKTEKRRNSREIERKNLLERRDSQNMRSSGGKAILAKYVTSTTADGSGETDTPGKILPGASAELGNTSF